MIQPGTLLLASPEITSSLFRKSVILVCEHSPEGSIGVMINKPLPTQSPEEQAAIEKLKAHQITALLGGPLHPNEAFMLHNNPQLEEDSIQLGQGIYLGSLIPIDPKDTQHHMRLIFGYAGWGPSQLEKEISSGLWIPVPSTEERVFTQTEPDLQWNQILKNLGGKYRALASFPTRLELN